MAYVLDTGIFASANDFLVRSEFGYPESRAKLGANCLSGTCTPGGGLDDYGHGTHVAGTLAGATVGVAKSAEVVAVKVLNSGGSGAWSGIIAGINWAVANCRARNASANGNVRCVINMSLAGGKSNSVNNAVNSAVTAGVVVAVAAGNDNTDACRVSPASAASALTVAATDSSDWRSVWNPPYSASNYGACVNVSAPGTDILSLTLVYCYTINGGNCTSLQFWSGTSMATPHVAGAALLLWSQYSTLSAAELSNKLLAIATTDVLQGLLPGTPNKLLYSPYTF